MEGHLTASRLNLVIQENSAELLKYGTAGPTIIRSVAIYKGDIQSALSKLSTFISQHRNFNNNVNFVVPPDQIKVFRKIVTSEDNKENITFIAKRVLTEQNNIDISEVFLDIISNFLRINLLIRPLKIKNIKNIPSPIRI